MYPAPEAKDASRPRPARGASLASTAGLAPLAVIVALLAIPESASAQPGGALKEVGFDQNLNAQVPLTLKFRDQEGQPVQLSDYFGKRPVILVMGYSNCPLLCSQVLGELTRSLTPLDASIGKDFDVITVSVNPKDTPEQADGMRRNYLKRYNTTYKRPGSEAGWHALTTGDEKEIQRLAKAIGFRYTYSPKLNLYAHASGFVLLTPSGRISHYFYGVDYPAKELKYALTEAAADRIGSPIDKLVLYCYDFDPATGKYTLAVMTLIRVFGVATALALGTFMFVMIRRDRRMARATRASTPDFPPGPAIP